MRYNTPMAVSENFVIAKEIGKKLAEALPIRLGVNKRNELVRLAYEISLAQGLSPEEVIQRAGIRGLAEEGKNGLFHRTKQVLADMRYPGSAGSNLSLVPLKLNMTPEADLAWRGEFRPKKIFIEKSVKDFPWTEEFIKRFPGTEVEDIRDLKTAIKAVSADGAIKTYNRRRDLAIIVENKDAFIKMCPCTKGAMRCGYMILNIGFGCPIDCSYCYLQTYSNVPGIILPANIDEYQTHIKNLDSKVRERTRIGTGEFTDSLALDRYTQYSRRLIPFFRDSRNLVLELKTKVSDIDNVLQTEPNKNVVISWSINTRHIAERYEKGAASVSDRIKAALAATCRGYKVGFHFDPIVHYSDWEKDYRNIVAELFSYENIRKNTEWISLGTLRYSPGLKQAAEQRFDDSIMFYEGNFFKGYDGKLRYPEKVRSEMYEKMKAWIEGAGTKAWVYLCMEPADMMQEKGKEVL